MIRFRYALVAAVALLAAGALMQARAAEVPHLTYDPAGHQGDVAVAAEFLPGSVARTNARRDKVRVVVDARGGTQQPGLQANPGDILRVKSKGGSWTVDGRSIRRVGVEGHLRETALHTDWGHRREVGRLPFGRLLLRVGTGPWLDAGAGVPLRTRIGGPLVFQINDRADSLSDNAGSVEVEVTLERTGVPAVNTSSSTAPTPAPQPTDVGPACAASRAALADHVKSLSRACRSDAECALANGFNPCSEMMAVRGTPDAAPALAALNSLRAAAWEACRFVPPPCAMVPVAARCVASRCTAVTLGSQGQPQPEPPQPAPADRCRDTVCPPGEHCRLEQVQCATAPCPPMPRCVRP